MAAVQVRLFAQLRERFGVAALALSVTEPADIRGLLQALDEHFAPLPAELRASLRAANVRIAVNQQLIEGSVALSDGDEVAFLPPVTGG